MKNYTQDIDAEKKGWLEQVELVEKTRETLVNAETDHVRREEMPFTPDAAGMKVTDASQRQGRPMDHKRMMKLLKKCNSNLYFEQSIGSPDKIGIYIIVNPANYPAEYKLYKGRLMFVTGMNKGVMPEFSIIEAEVSVRPDPNGVEDPNTGERVAFHNSFKEEKRGWRTVLFNLLKGRFVTEPQLEKHFQISLGQQSERWHQMTHTPIELLTEETILGGNNGRDQRNAEENGLGSGTSDIGRSGQLDGGHFDFRAASKSDIGFRGICGEGSEGAGRGDEGASGEREAETQREHEANAGGGATTGA